MSAAEVLRTPSFVGAEICDFVGGPRPKPFFRTVIDSREVFGEMGMSSVRTSLSREGREGEGRLEIEVAHQLKLGRVVERCVLSAGASLRTLELSRTVDDEAGARVRHETVEFTRGPVRMPETAYPEVLLPFVMRGQPFDGQRRSLHAWINDRFLAKVYYEVQKRGAVVAVPAGRFRTIEVVMYPDLNDWVPMGSMMTALAKPFLPKYHMWFDEAAPHRVIRFEGPYGPPGAPEVLLELHSFRPG